MNWYMQSGRPDDSILAVHVCPELAVCIHDSSSLDEESPLLLARPLHDRQLSMRCSFGSPTLYRSNTHA